MTLEELEKLTYDIEIGLKPAIWIDVKKLSLPDNLSEIQRDKYKTLTTTHYKNMETTDNNIVSAEHVITDYILAYIHEFSGEANEKVLIEILESLFWVYKIFYSTYVLYITEDAFSYMLEESTYYKILNKSRELGEELPEFLKYHWYNSMKTIEIRGKEINPSL